MSLLANMRIILSHVMILRQYILYFYCLSPRKALSLKGLKAARYFVSLLIMSNTSNLRDERFFPPFSSCPADYEMDLGYYISSDSLYYEPRHHWCLLAEIVEASQFFRVRLVARDKQGGEIVVAFYIDREEAQPYLRQYRVGDTIAILYAHRHNFLDGSSGIRQEVTKGVQASAGRRTKGESADRVFRSSPCDCRICWL